MRALVVSVILAMGAGLLRAQPGEETQSPEAPPPPRRARVPYPPISVAPPMIEVPRSIAVPAAPDLPPAQAARPAAITTCDPGGCWDSEGRRLNSVGPLLVGPQGACTAQSGVVRCP